MGACLAVLGALRLIRPMLAQLSTVTHCCLILGLCVALYTGVWFLMNHAGK